MSEAAATKLFDRVALLGAGLIGSSLAWAIRERGLADHIAAYSRRDETREVIDILGFAHSVHADPGEAVKDADLMDPASLASHGTALAPVTHVLYAALFEMDDLIDGWRAKEPRL